MKIFSLFIIPLVMMTQSTSVIAKAITKPAVTLPQQAKQPALVVPPPEVITLLIRSAAIALAQANLTNNYSVLSGLGSPNFIRSNSPDQLAVTFSWFRTQKVDISPVAFLTPQLSLAPRIDNGRLRLTGAFPSKPMQINFDLTFEPSQGKWKILILNVNMTQSK